MKAPAQRAGAFLLPLKRVLKSIRQPLGNNLMTA